MFFVLSLLSPDLVFVCLHSAALHPLFAIVAASPIGV